MTLAAEARLRELLFAPGEDMAIAGIWRRAWAVAHPDVEALEPIAHWLERVQSEFKSPTEVLVLEREAQLLAFMAIHRANGYVAQLFVDSHLRHHGLGRQLLHEACMRMPIGWRLHVATANTAAQDFYARYGLARGSVDRHPNTGRERVSYHWRSGVPLSASPEKKAAP